MKTRNFELTASAFMWEISPGRSVEAWGFNKTLPGPSLKADKGDRLVIKVVNNLTEPTVVHWHGIRLPATMDGTDSVQKPIEPGQSFTYDFIVPDSGTFWYHAHQNETVQMERGMYGSLIVADPNDPNVDADKVFMVDDMKLNSKNEFKNGNFLSRWIERHDGREGNTLLINGRENFDTIISAGQTERWRFINSSSARYFRLNLGGKKFRVIATDGGLIETPVEMDEIMLVPGERADILVGPFAEGEQFPIESLAYNRMTMIKSGKKTFGQVQVIGARETLFKEPHHMRHIEQLARPNAEPSRRIRFSVGPSLKNGMDFLVNGEMHATDKPAKVGELQIWEVSNTSLMDHPFHLHGFFFQVLETNGKAPAFISWKDTINLPPRSKVKIAWMPDDRPGSWMYHCHILEHHEAGMMGHFDVAKSDEEPVAAPKKHHHHHYS